MIKPRCKVPKTEAAEPGSAKWRCRISACLVRLKGVLRKRGSCPREISRRPKKTPANRFGRYTIFLPFRYSLSFRVTLDLRRGIELRQRTNPSHAFDRLVVSAEHLIRFLQVSSGLANMTIVLIESGLAGSDGIGGQLIG
jgi:hypothetical protein